VAFLFPVFLGGFTQKIHAVASRTPVLRRRAQGLRPATPLPGTSPLPAEPSAGPVLPGKASRHPGHGGAARRPAEQPASTVRNLRPGYSATPRMYPCAYVACRPSDTPRRGPSVTDRGASSSHRDGAGVVPRAGRSRRNGSHVVVPAPTEQIEHRVSRTRRVVGCRGRRPAPHGSPPSRRAPPPPPARWPGPRRRAGRRPR